MPLDLQKIKKNYSEFEDYRIEHLAKNEVAGLNPDVIPILIEEIEKRGLNLDLIKGIEAQLSDLTESEVLELKNIIVNLPCPECGLRHNPLIGTIVRTVKSFILFTSYKKIHVISCTSCADKKVRNAMISTAILGWWGIPFGVFRTPMALISTWIDNNKREKISDQVITIFIYENKGELKSNWRKENELVDYIRHVNNRN